LVKSCDWGPHHEGEGQTPVEEVTVKRSERKVRRATHFSSCPSSRADPPTMAVNTKIDRKWNPNRCRRSTLLPPVWVEASIKTKIVPLLPIMKALD